MRIGPVEHAPHPRRRRRRYVSRPVRYPVETFTEAERPAWPRTSRTSTGRSSRSSDLPETVKGALFARYSRYQGTLRRLFLDEFADSLPAGGGLGRRRGPPRR